MIRAVVDRARFGTGRWKARLLSIHSGGDDDAPSKEIHWTLGLLIVGMAAPFTGAAAQDRGPCRQIREVCQGAGFVQGAARQGVGLQSTVSFPSCRQGLNRRRRASHCRKSTHNWWRTARQAIQGSGSRTYRKRLCNRCRQPRHRWNLRIPAAVRPLLPVIAVKLHRIPARTMRLAHLMQRCRTGKR